MGGKFLRSALEQTINTRVCVWKAKEPSVFNLGVTPAATAADLPRHTNTTPKERPIHARENSSVLGNVSIVF